MHVLSDGKFMVHGNDYKLPMLRSSRFLYDIE